jgi:hypothetical protein
MPFPKVPDDEVAEMRKMRADGTSNPQIAKHFGRNVVTVRAKTKGIRPKGSEIQREEPVQPQLDDEQPEREPEARPGEVEGPRRRLETVTPLSPTANGIHEVARIVADTQAIQNAMGGSRESPVDIALKLAELEQMKRGPVEEELIALRARNAELEKGADSTAQLLSIERLRGEQEIGRTQLQLSIAELQHANAIDIKKMELGSDQVQQGRFWMTEVLPQLPVLVEKTVVGMFAGLAKAGVHPGELLRNSRKVVGAIEPEIVVGGLVGKPVALADIRKTITARGPTGERVPRTDAEWSGELELLTRQDLHEGGRKSHVRRDRDREDALATQLAEARHDLAELKSRIPSPPSERRVVAAGKLVEEEHHA